MAKAKKKPSVAEFLLQMQNGDPSNYEIVEQLRSLVQGTYRSVNERIMYGGILFSLDSDFGGVFSYQEHVSFEFSAGSQMDDPEQRLEGKGKFRRHLKFRSVDDISEKDFAFYLRQIVNLQ